MCAIRNGKCSCIEKCRSDSGGALISKYKRFLNQGPINVTLQVGQPILKVSILHTGQQSGRAHLRRGSNCIWVGSSISRTHIYRIRQRA